MGKAGYGSTADNSQGGDEKKLPAWAAERGSVLKLVIAVASSSSTHIVTIITMFISFKGHESDLVSCRTDSTLNLGGIWLCEYTKAYVQCFPELCLSVLLLFMGRNLLQSRLYYNLLQQKAVMLFNSRNPLIDSLVKAILLCFAHVLGHIGLLLYMALAQQEVQLLEQQASAALESRGQPLVVEPTHTHAYTPTGPPPHVDSAPESADMFDLFALCTKVIVPSLFFLVFLCLTYNIEESLVPLSEYFHDARDIDQGHAQDVSCTLMSMSDVAALALVEDKPQLFGDGKETTLEGDLIYAFRTEGAGYEKRNDLPPLGLLEALWPARLLGSSKVSGPQARLFRLVWLGFAGIASVLCVSLTLLLSHMIFEDFDRLLSEVVEHAGNGGEMIHLAVVVLHMIAVFYVSFVFLNTFRTTV